MSDEDLITLGTKEIAKLGIVPEDAVEDGTIVRMPKAYPVYDDTYASHLAAVKSFLDQFTNLQLVGRNGMHKYNNQDHSMLTAMFAAENILGANHDLWAVNVEQEYHEEITQDEGEHSKAVVDLASTQPLVPETVPTALDTVLMKVFARIDKAALAVATGTVSGLTLFIATIWLVLAGGPNPGATLILLNQYFIGFEISVAGAFVGLAYSFFWGFILGWLFAYLHNLMLGLYIRIVMRQARADSMKDLLDYI